MSATRKIEITEHTQQNWMDRTIERMAPYRRAILGLGLALVVGVIAVVLLSNQNKQKQERAWDNYFSVEQITAANEEAARKMIAELGNTEAALMLKMKLGHFLQREGTQLLFSDKKTGSKKLNEAKEYFSLVASSSKNPMVIEEALLGAATCEDSLGNVDAAIAAYEKQLQKFPQGMYAKIAADNIELLKTDDAKEWYATFTKADVASSDKSIDPFPDFGKRPTSNPGSLLGPGPALEGPGSLMPSLDSLNLPGTGVPSTTPGLPNFSIPGATTTDPATKDGTTTPEKSNADPAATPDASSPPATTPATTPEKSAKPEPAKTEPSTDTPASIEPEPAAKK